MTLSTKQMTSATDEIDLVQVSKKIWDGRKIILKWVGIFFVFGIVIIVISPNEYKSEVKLLIEAGPSMAGMSGLLQQFGGLTGLNFNSAAEEALTPELYPDIIESTPFLLEIMNEKVTESKHNTIVTVQDYLDRYSKPGIVEIVMSYTIGLPMKIYGWFKGNTKKAEVDTISRNPLQLTSKQTGMAGELLSRIKTRSGESNSIMVISVEMQDPKVAALLVDSVVKSLTGYIIDYRTQKAKTDLQFVMDRQAEAEKKYMQAQKKLASFRDRNKNVILASAQTTEENLQAEYNLAFNVYNTLSQQLEQAKMKVQERTPVFKVVEPAKVPLRKSKPGVVRITLISVFVGIAIGMIIILFKSQETLK